MRLSILLTISLGCAAFACAQDRIRVSDAEAKKAVTTRVEPAYPPMAKQMKIVGHVIVDAEVGAEGTVERVDVVIGNTLLAGSCIAAVKKWKFVPFTAGGKNTAAIVRLGFNFHL